MRERMLSIVGKNGSTTEYLGQQILSGNLDMDLVCVISNDPGNASLAKMDKLGFATDFVFEKNFPDKKDFNLVLRKTIRKYNPTVISLNGTLMIIPDEVIDEYPIYNQHGAPKVETRNLSGPRLFATMLNLIDEVRLRYGEEAAALQREKGTDAVIHRVIKGEVDGGPTVAITHYPILENDTVESLMERGKGRERDMQLDFWKDYVKGIVNIVNHEPRYMEDMDILKIARRNAISDYPRE